ncbi:hypothetical protein MMC11_004097 [Xylographa trunciseda]|nr:hypothetical protein [Xylographa trunciseda]
MSAFHYPTIRYPSPYQEDSDHPHGYIHIKSFKSSKVTLVYSPDDKEFYVRKIISHNHYSPEDPPEIQFSNLAAKSHFPELPFLPGAIEAACIDANGVWCLMLEFYNGGTLESFIETYSKQNKPIPEPFIWHVIDQTARAYAYLHFGHVDGRKAEDKDWVPIVHRDGANNNIFLHFREPGIKPRKSDRFIDAFPRIVLGDLGYANRLGDPEEQSSGGCFDEPEINQWEDVVLFGEAVRRMLYTSIDVEIGDFIDEFPRLRDANLEGLYSEDLIAALERFEPPPGPHYWNQDTAKRLPQMRHVAEVLLPQAIIKVQEYKQEGIYDSVRWAQQRETSLMPYVLDPNDKRGLRTLMGFDYAGGWQPAFGAVDIRFGAAGMEIVDLEEEDYPECLQKGFDLSIPQRAFDEINSLWATANYAHELLKTSAKRAARREAANSEQDTGVLKDIELVRAALKVLYPVHHEDEDSDTSSESSNNDHSDNDAPTDDSADDDESQGEFERRSKSRSPDPKRESRAASKGERPKDEPRSRSRSAEIKDMGSLEIVDKGKKRVREVSVVDVTRGKRQKGLPKVRETITTTTTRESF